MSIISIIFIGIGLAMDAFAVSLTVGMNTVREKRMKMALKCGLLFGGFQALMPLIGWTLGISFTSYIKKVDHWIAFILLVLIGGKTLVEGFKGSDELDEMQEYSNKRFILLAIATSIDALAIGVSFAFLNVNISSFLLIGAITFAICFIAVYVGRLLGSLFKARAEMFGGIILILIGLKILIEHLSNG